MRKGAMYGSVRGAISDGRPYRDSPGGEPSPSRLPHFVSLLSGIHMREGSLVATTRAIFLGNRSPLPERLDPKGRKMRRRRAANVVGIDPAEAIYGKVRCLRSQALQKTARVENCWVFDLRSDDLAGTAVLSEEHTFERVIVGLAAPAGEDDLIRGALYPQQPRGAYCEQPKQLQVLRRRQLYARRKVAVSCPRHCRLNDGTGFCAPVPQSLC